MAEQVEAQAEAARAAAERETALRGELDAATAREAAANKRADELKARLTEDRAILGPELMRFAIQLRSAGEKAAAKKAEKAAAIAAAQAEMRVRDELMVETDEAESDVLRAAADGRRRRRCRGSRRHWCPRIRPRARASTTCSTAQSRQWRSVVFACRSTRGWVRRPSGATRSR